MITSLQAAPEICLLPEGRRDSSDCYLARLIINETFPLTPVVFLGTAQEAREKLIIYRDLYGFGFASKTPRLFSLLCLQAREEAERMGGSVQSATDLVETIILQVAVGETDPPLLPHCMPSQSDPRLYYQNRYQNISRYQAESFACFQILRCLQSDDPARLLRQEITEMLLQRERFASLAYNDRTNVRHYRWYTSVCISYIRSITSWLLSTQRFQQ